jgi:hypothetical protein
MLPLRDELLDLWLASMFPDASPADLQTKRAELAQAMEWVEVWILYRVRFFSSARLILSTQLLTRELSVTARHHCPRHPGSRRARSGQLGRCDRDGQSRGGRSPRQDLRPENPGPPGLGSVGEGRGEGAALTASHAIWRCSSCGRRAAFALMTVCASKDPAYHPGHAGLQTGSGNHQRDRKGEGVEYVLEGWGSSLCTGHRCLVVVVVLVGRLVAVEIGVEGALLGAEADRRGRNRRSLRKAGEEEVGQQSVDLACVSLISHLREDQPEVQRMTKK